MYFRIAESIPESPPPHKNKKKKLKKYNFRGYIEDEKVQITGLLKATHIHSTTHGAIICKIKQQRKKGGYNSLFLPKIKS